jgi:hypothetical protein
VAATDGKIVGRFGQAYWAGLALVLWAAPGIASASDRGAGGSAPTAARSPVAVLRLARWEFETGDAKREPLAIIDKKNARIFVFDAGGRLAGSAPVLLGQTKGDVERPGVGRLNPRQIEVSDRVTPAGRFDSQPGHNLNGEAIVWVNYDTAIAIHRLRPSDPAQRRPQRLASATPEDNRVSLGCIVVESTFYDDVVAPTLGRRRGVVIVLPETHTASATFGSLLSADH